MNGLALGLLASLAGTGPADGPPVEYASALSAYASGQRDAAVRQLGALSWEQMDAGYDRFRSEVERAGRCAACPDTLADEPIRAAAMLHLDRDLLENPPHQDVEQPPPCGGRHAERALQYAELLAVRERTREFARRFVLAMTWRAEWDACLYQARTWARNGLASFPDDPDLLLALGVSYEKAARLGTGRSDRKRLLSEARRHLSRAVAAAPDRRPARVHLGRVEWRLGLSDEAQRTLEAAVATGGDAGSLYLAHVFLGQLHARAGRAQAAAEAYRRALQIRPGGSVAELGLAHGLRLAGDFAAAALAAERALARGDARPDPYRDYNADNAAGFEALFDALREESRR